MPTLIAAKPVMFIVVILLGLLCLAEETAAQEAGPDIEHITGIVFPPGFPFSEAVRVGDKVYVSGTIAVEPGAEHADEVRLVEGGIEPEARQTMDHVRAIVEAAGSSMDRVVHCTVYLVDIEEWPIFNEIYETYFDPPFPARTAAGVNELALGARVEVDCVAVTDGG